MRAFESENLILSQLVDPELVALERMLEPLLLPRDFELVHTGTPVSHYYFLESGIAAMVATSPEGRKAEIGAETECRRRPFRWMQSGFLST